MIPDTISKTALWERTLATPKRDPHQSDRERLRVALDLMRENVTPLVRDVHRDVLGLTVHDESHLDALWQTADIIAGPDFPLNPAEAFVFGAAVLLHDTAMAIAGYAGGLEALRESTEWKDFAAPLLPGGHEGKLDSEQEHRVLFSVLRSLHARQAEQLIHQHYSRPGRDEKLMLLPDVGLRDASGASIGRIAHSHHWNAVDLPERLISAVGAAPGFPPEWTIDEVKIACLLRCADAAHIDSRRAPTMLYALGDPSGISEQHWNFQNKLNQVTRVDDKLVFTSGQPFNVTEAASWWLCYDTLKMIDRELKQCNAILGDYGPEFAAKSVLGIETPQLISKQIKIDGWTPVDAEVRVSDPIHLARTLGGRNLYGDDVLAPIRELLQNAVDAVRARRLQEDRDGLWGKVRLIVEKGEDDEVFLLVDDNGIGMSERVLTGPLIDFGNSLWSSSLMQDEFPGLLSRNIEPIGKFGIGFFSAFLLGDKVSVASRRYDAGTDRIRVLEFDELGRRPLVRPPIAGELPTDFSTRASVKLAAAARKVFESAEAADNLNRRVIRMVSSVDVEVEYADKLNDIYHRHKPDWFSAPPEVFLEELLGTMAEQARKKIISAHAGLLQPVTDASGKIYGRAALALTDQRSTESLSAYSVGGFVVSVGPYRRLDRYSYSYLTEGPSVRGRASMLGVIFGETEDAARHRSHADIPPEALAEWASDQARRWCKLNVLKDQAMGLCHQIIELGADPEGLPFAFAGGCYVSLAKFEKLLEKQSVIALPVKQENYRYGLGLKSPEGLASAYFTAPVKDNVVVFPTESLDFDDEVISEERREAIIKGSPDLAPEELSKVLNKWPMRLLSASLEKCWGGLPTVGQITGFQAFAPGLVHQPNSAWSLILRRDS